MFVDHTPLTRKLNSRRFRSVQARFFFPIARAYRCGRHSGDKSGEPLHRGPGARVSPLCRGFPVLARVTYRPIHWPAEGFSQAPPAPAVAPFPKALRPAHQLSDLCGRRTNFQTKHPVQPAANGRELP
jgi:hypothetical protein